MFGGQGHVCLIASLFNCKNTWTASNYFYYTCESFRSQLFQLFHGVCDTESLILWCKVFFLSCCRPCENCYLWVPKDRIAKFCLVFLWCRTPCLGWRAEERNDFKIVTIMQFTYVVIQIWNQLGHWCHSCIHWATALMLLDIMQFTYVIHQTWNQLGHWYHSGTDWATIIMP